MDAPRSITVKTYMLGLSTETGPRLLVFRESNLLIGRLPDNHLGLNHGSVSRRHARLAVTPKGVVIEDMGSQNGTTLNGNPVATPTNVRPGDILRIGHVPLYYFGFIDPNNPPAAEVVEASVLLSPMTPALA
ncbi:MAG: FHA domain-containing protein [Candidatus Sumerlaeia bacterium]|nr:FHA domain-containing protein [Candidatus Sumerlaeia bacterium]